MENVTSELLVFVNLTVEVLALSVKFVIVFMLKAVHVHIISIVLLQKLIVRTFELAEPNNPQVTLKLAVVKVPLVTIIPPNGSHKKASHSVSVPLTLSTTIFCLNHVFPAQVRVYDHLHANM